MRLVAGIALVDRAAIMLRAVPPIGPVARHVLAIVDGLFLCAGLWTPISASLAALLGLSDAISQRWDPWAGILLATIGAGLALLGPGAWSIDARLYGWKRITVPGRSRES